MAYRNMQFCRRHGILNKLYHPKDCSMYTVFTHFAKVIVRYAMIIPCFTITSGSGTLQGVHGWVSHDDASSLCGLLKQRNN
jgi:hypothetical protein